MASTSKNERQILMSQPETQVEISSDNGEGIRVPNGLSNSVDQTSLRQPVSRKRHSQKTLQRRDDEAMKNIFSVQLRGSMERLWQAKEVLRT